MEKSVNRNFSAACPLNNPSGLKLGLYLNWQESVLMNIGRAARILSLFIFLPLFLPGHEIGAPPLLAAAQYREDLNRDSRVDREDLLYLLRMAREMPGDPRADYDGDGRYTVTDAVRLLLDIAGGRLTPITGSAALPVPGRLEVYPTWSAVGVELAYSGQFGPEARPLLFWRFAGEAYWSNGVEMTVDTERSLILASIFPLEPSRQIDLRVLFYEPNSSEQPSLEASTATLALELAPAGGRSLYVAPSGNDSAAGTQETPLGTFGHAASLARPGDIIYAAGGVYREGELGQGLYGTESQPIVFAAAPGQAPILDSSLEIADSAGAWPGQSGQVYVTTLGTEINTPDGFGYGYVAQDGDRVFPYESLSDLTGDRLGVPRACFYDSRTRKLYLRTGLGDSPGNHRYNIARHAYAFRLSGSQYVVVRGFEMRYYGSAGVRLSEGAHGCVVTENIIHNSPNGVFMKNGETSGNAIWRNELYEQGLLDIPWYSIKAGEYPRQGIMCSAAGRGNSFCFNTIYGWFDGIAVESWQMPEAWGTHRDTDVMFNQIYNIGDDAFEMDGDGLNMRLHGNSVRNAMVAISLAPVERGPVYVTRNQVTFWNLMFKFNVGSPWSAGPTYVYHNSGYGLNSGNGMGLVGLTGTASGGPDLRNKVIKNNAMIGADRAVRTGYDGDNYLDYDCYYHTPGLTPRKFEWNGVTYATLEDFRAATGQEAHGLYADPRFSDTPGLGAYPWKGFEYDQVSNYPAAEYATGGDFRPRPDSPLIDRGAHLRGINDDFRGRAPDIGALEY